MKNIIWVISDFEISEKDTLKAGSNNSMGGSTKSQKAGRLKRLEAKIVKKPASYRDYMETYTVVHDHSGTRYSGTIPITRPYENPPFSYYINPIECAWI